MRLKRESPEAERTGSRWEFTSWALPDGERYTVLHEFARGGLGRILEATDRRLNRSVAIKELIRSSDEEDNERFLREAMITARLEHPSIVPVHDVGRWRTGQPYIAMKMISGRSLCELIAEKKTLEERLSLLPNIIAVADAMAYAHSKRVIHRDLNPSNILIGSFGETVIIDWGLVADLSHKQGSSLAGAPRTPAQASASPEKKRAASAPSLTLTGVVLGTAEYMPLEQAQGETVDERADVYAIGAILYHVLAGSPPYQGETSHQILEEVLSRPPEPLERRQPRVAGELLTILNKAMAREADHRYRTARELADDLKRFQTGKLVSAHSYGLLGLVSHRLRTYRLPVKAVAVAALALMVFAGFAFTRVIQSNLAKAARNERILVEARAALETDPTAALAWLKHYPATKDNLATVRDIALQAVEAGPAREVWSTQSSYASASPDGRRLALSSSRGLQLRELPSGALMKELSHSGRIHSTQFSPDGKLVLFFDWNGTVVFLWDIQSGMVRTLQGPVGEVNAAAFSPDGKSVLSVSADRKLRLWSAYEDRTEVLGVHRGNPTHLLFANKSDRFATATDEGELRIWSLSRQASQLVANAGGEISAVAFSPDDQVIAWSEADHSIGLWNFSTQRLTRLVGHSGEVTSLSFSPGGQSLASGSADGTVRVWDLVSGDSRTLRGHRSQVWVVAFDLTGRLVASAGQDGLLRFWDPSVDKPVKVLRGHQSFIYDLKFLPDTRTLLTSANDGTTRLWSVPSETGRIFSGHTDDINDVAWSPDGRSFATASKDKSVRVWETATGRATTLIGHSGEIIKLAYSPDGTRIASAAFDHTIRLWNFTSGQSLILRGHENAVWDIAFSPNGQQLASAGLDGTVRLWDLRSGVARILRGHEGPVRSIVFSKDGSVLASGSSDGTVRLWTISAGWSRLFRGHTDAVYEVALSQDGRLVASGSDDRTARVWEVETGEARVLAGHRERLRTVSFIGRTHQLLTAADDKTLRIWSANGESEKTLRGHRSLIYDATVSPDGRLAATASADRTVRVWDLRAGTLLAVHRHEGDVKRVAFSPDGSQLVSVSEDQTARLWRAHETQEIPEAISELGGWLNSVTSMDVNPESE